MAAISMSVLVALAALIAGVRASCPTACSCSGAYMICSSAGLTTPPEGYWPSVTNLVLYNNNIQTLFEHSFTGFPAVTEVILRSNSLTVLSFEPFAVLPNLNSLDLGENSITKLATPPPGLQIPNSRFILHIESNKISQMDPNILATVFPNLDTVFMGYNPITLSAEQPLMNHPKLAALVMYGVDASNMGPQTFKGVPELREIYLGFSGVTNITGVFDYLNLMQVDLQSNDITELLPGTFNSGRRIQQLILNKNPLKRLELKAINEAMFGDKMSLVDLDDTPLACECQYDAVYWWGQGRGVEVQGGCAGVNDPCGLATAS